MAKTQIILGELGGKNPEIYDGTGKQQAAAFTIPLDLSDATIVIITDFTWNNPTVPNTETSSIVIFFISDLSSTPKTFNLTSDNGTNLRSCTITDTELNVAAGYNGGLGLCPYKIYKV